MRFMNEYDVAEANRRWDGHTVLGPAVKTLVNLMEWTNSHSDGWAYWPKPARAAEKLMALIEGDDHPEGRRGAMFDHERADVTAESLKAALRPIKAFRTRQEADFTILETLADVRAADEAKNDLQRRSHIALAQEIANEYGVTITPNLR